MEDMEVRSRKDGGGCGRGRGGNVGRRGKSEEGKISCYAKLFLLDAHHGKR